MIKNINFSRAMAIFLARSRIRFSLQRTFVVRVEVELFIKSIEFYKNY